MTNLIWNIGRGELSTHPYTFQLFLRKGHFGELPEALNVPELCLWLVVDSDSGYLIAAKLIVAAIEVFDEGPEAGSLLLTGDIDHSYYFLPSDHASLSRWRVPAELNPLVLRAETPQLLTDAEVGRLNESVNGAIERSFSPPSQHVVSRSLELINGKDIHDNIGEIIRQLKTIFPLGELPLNTRHPETWDSYASVTYFCLEALGVDSEKAQVRITDCVSAVRMKSARGVQSVDTSLTPLVADRIVARSFRRLRSWQMDDFTAAILKTERAEKRHQAILKDIVSVLIASGKECMETRSVDLAVQSSNGLSLFEVKSATEDNFFSQVMKAVLQLLYYAHAFRLAGAPVVRLCVIVDKPPQYVPSEELQDFLSSLNIELLVYDEMQEWPTRLPGLS